EGEHLDLGRAARAGSGDDALAAGRKVYEPGGDADPRAVLTVRFKRREQRRCGAGRCGQRKSIDLHFARDAGARSHDDIVGRGSIDLSNSHADTATRSAIEGLEACQLRSESAFATPR